MSLGTSTSSSEIDSLSGKDSETISKGVEVVELVKLTEIDFTSFLQLEGAPLQFPVGVQ